MEDINYDGEYNVLNILIMVYYDSNPFIFYLDTNG